MDIFEELNYIHPNQQRSFNTIKDIVDTLLQLAKNKSVNAITAQELSLRSGYAMGTIFHHFRNLDDIILYTCLLQQKKIINDLALILQNHPSNQSIYVLAENILNSLNIFSEPSSHHSESLQYCANLFIKRSHLPLMKHIDLDLLIPIWLQICHKDMTFSFFKHSENATQLRMKCILSAIIYPIFDGTPIAGTPEHRAIAFEMFMQLFSNTDYKAH